MNQMERAITGEVEVPAPLEQVWEAWTTEAGIRSFFAPDCKVDLRPDGMYEIYFNPTAPKGLRGGEGLRILSIQPMHLFSFTWNAPPSLPDVRDQRTHVVVRFHRIGSETRVTFYHGGWGTGGQWEDAYAYFDRAWNRIVLPRLRYRFLHGPVDWNNPPSPDDMAA